MSQRAGEGGRRAATNGHHNRGRQAVFLKERLDEMGATVSNK